MVSVQTGLRANAAQFSLLVLVNAFVGAMAGMERGILPMIAEGEFGLKARTAVLSFILMFGLTKAFTNYFAGRLSDRFGRKRILVAGWLVAAPVPFLLMWSPTWNLILLANALLGISQGLSWSATVIMKIDLVGEKRRGLAMGLNEFAGYIAVAASSLATGFIAANYGLRPEPFYLGIGFVALGLLLSVFLVRETFGHAVRESTLRPAHLFSQASVRDRNLSSANQVGFVNNLNDALTWGAFPLLFAAAGMSIQQVGILAAVCPATWGITQLGTGILSDRIGRKHLIAAGMWVQAGGIALVAVSSGFFGFFLGTALLGLGTAMVYPTLLAAVGDVVPPKSRASSVGVYRLWRDLGYVGGALLVGVIGDGFELEAATWSVAALTLISGIAAALRMTETLYLKSSIDEGSGSTWLYPVR